MVQRPRLSKAAIPAAFFLILAAAAMFLHHSIITYINDQMMYVIGAILVIISFMLFTRKRNTAYGVFFIILVLISAFGLRNWINLLTVVPFAGPIAYYYGARTLCFLGLSIVCLRRRNEPRSGPWFLSVCIYIVAIPLLLITGLMASQIQNLMIIYLSVTELLLFLGLLLTAVAFRHAPQEPEAHLSEDAVVSSPGYGQVLKSASAEAGEKPKTEKTSTVQSPSEALKTEQRTPSQMEKTETEQIETAQIEWLEDD